ncbi:MAG: hypothetical protein A3K76_04360 [Euryarchaeota archaeon RBG_13_57_23]|nr:MAG: hypothetical protein A3K76_04360 [Euryarchaeota archaeon RBG_13_57_23]
MTASIPPKAMKYLKHLPKIATWIRTNKQISGGEMVLFRTLFPEPYRMLKDASYEKISEVITPYQDDPQYGEYVRVALSPQGEQWLRYALDLIKRS